MELQAFIEFAERYKNWGRWGEEDEIGTLNFVTPEHIVEACRLVRTGRIFALAIPFDEKGPQRPRADSRRFNPIHTMLVTGFDAEGMTSDNPPVRHSTDDMIAMPLQAATQWDSLAHIVFQGKMYNGRPYSLVDGKGAHKNSITAMKSRAMGRGVLLDVARHRGVDWLTPGEAIEGEELEECAARQGVAVKEGDFLLVRTGNLAMCRDQPGWGEFAGGARPGLGLSSIPWLHEKRVAAVAADNYGVEVHPSQVEGLQRSPLHLACIANMGLLFGEIFDMEELAADCAQDRVYEFLFVAPPLPVTRAVGSPINPYAVK